MPSGRTRVFSPTITRTVPSLPARAFRPSQVAGEEAGTGSAGGSACGVAGAGCAGRVGCGLPWGSAGGAAATATAAALRKTRAVEAARRLRRDMAMGLLGLEGKARRDAPGARARLPDTHG